MIFFPKFLSFTFLLTGCEELYQQSVDESVDDYIHVIKNIHRPAESAVDKILFLLISGHFYVLIIF